MKHLFLMRHSKAIQAESAQVSDHARSLTPQGEDLLELAAQYMQQKPALDHIAASDSIRTSQTAHGMGAHLSLSAEILSSHPVLYLASRQEILQFIHGLDERWQHVMLVGHNPGIHDALLSLIGKGDKYELRLLRASYPPAAITHLCFAVDYWAEILEQSGQLMDFFSHKRL